MEQPAQSSSGLPKGPDLFNSETAIESFMAEHKVVRRDQITFTSDGQWLISGKTVEDWDAENALYSGSDHDDLYRRDHN